MKKSRVTAAVIFLSALFLGACGVRGAGADDGANASGANVGADDGGVGAETDTEEADALVLFSKEDAAVVPAIPEYSFEEATEAGTVQELYGMLPGAAEGTWYIVTVDGVEHYYGAYGQAGEDIAERFDDASDGFSAEQFGFAIFSDAYSLANGIAVGMTQEEILAAYPNMAVVDFEGRSLQGDGEDFRGIGSLGWNPAAYPRSNAGMDSGWDYGGNDYVWSNQFDHLLIAEVDTGETDALPLYMGLLIKDHVVAAITFYYPTAG